MRTNLHESPEQFDADYGAWLKKRLGATVANFDKWRVELKALVGMSEKHDDDGVIAAAGAVIKLYPDYVEDANAYEILANAQLIKGNKQAALDALKLSMRRGVARIRRHCEKLAVVAGGFGASAGCGFDLGPTEFYLPRR